MRFSDTRKFCDFISTYSAKLNHVNVTVEFLSQNTSSFAGSRVDKGHGGIPTSRNYPHSPYHGENTITIQDLSFVKDTTTDGDGIRGVQLENCYQHSVDVYDDGDNTGGSDDVSTGAVGGGDIREFNSQDVANMLW